MINQHDRNRSGVVFIITLVVLVLLASLGYALTSRVLSQRHRDQYIMDYQTARYACDSAYKYAFGQVKLVTPRLIDRPNEPDFSDLFAFTEEEYDRLIQQYFRELAARAAASRDDSNDPYYSRQNSNDVNSNYLSSHRDYRSNNYDVNTSSRTIDHNKPRDPNYPTDFNSIDANGLDRNDPNHTTIPGPYGAAWPLVTEPMEITIGNSVITVEIEDENAKLPLAWGTMFDKENFRKAQAALDTFCEWMASVSKGKTLDPEQVRTLKSELQELARISDPTIAAPAGKDPNKADPNKSEPNKPAAPAPDPRNRRSRQSKPGTPAAPARSPLAQYSDFARLVNSSLVHTEPLAVPYIKSPRRTESALKYVDRWGSKQVNVNTAPRQVLEALFTFGGDAPEAADAVITERKIHPFKDFADLQKRVFRYSDTFTRCKAYILTESKFFTVKITAVSGIATVHLTAGIVREGSNVQLITIFSD